MSTLFLLLVAPLLLSAVAVLLRRWPRTMAWLGAGSAALLALAIVVITPRGGEPALQWDLVGRLLVVDVVVGEVLALLYAGSAVVLGLAALWPQGRDFVPALLASLAPLALALMVRPFVYGAVALLVAAIILVALIQAGRAGSTLAATRYLTVMVLMLPFFLVAGWMLDSQQLIFLRSLWRLLLVGFGLLLAAIPFHFWLRPLLEETTALAAVFILGLSQLALVAFAGIVIAGNPILAQTELGFWLSALGLATMVAAAMLLLAAREMEQAIAYAVLLDGGAVLAALGTGGAGLPTALLLVLSRSVALTLVMVGLQLWRQEGQETSLPSEASTQPGWTLLLLGYGAFSLLGLPLTPGFAGRWQAIALLGEQSSWMALLAVLAVAVAAVGLWRALPHRPIPSVAELRGRQMSAPQIVAVVLLLIAVLLTLFPGWLPDLAAMGSLFT
jgi:formate hydrogenlyase subunit 3/multisubunit Na+/H+ antiporter MnhD subunit